MSSSSVIVESDENDPSILDNDQSTAAALHKTYMDLLACGFNSSSFLCTPRCVLTDEEPTSERSNLPENIPIHPSTPSIHFQDSSQITSSSGRERLSTRPVDPNPMTRPLTRMVAHAATSKTPSINSTSQEKQEFCKENKEQTSCLIESDTDSEGPQINCNIFQRLREIMRVQRTLLRDPRTRYYQNKNKNKKSEQMYQIRMDCCKSKKGFPEQLIFDLVNEQIHEQDSNGTKNSKNSKIKFKKKDRNVLVKEKKTCQYSDKFQEIERFQVYYFDHGNSGYYQTTDPPLPFITDYVIDQTDHYVHRFWSGVFGYLHVPAAFFIIFFTQLFRFLLASVVRPIIIGFFQISSDYFLKPILASIFNSIIQPLFILTYNGMTSLHDLLIPVSSGLGLFTRELARLLRAIRFIEVTNNSNASPSPLLAVTNCNEEEAVPPPPPVLSSTMRCHCTRNPSPSPPQN